MLTEAEERAVRRAVAELEERMARAVRIALEGYARAERQNRQRGQRHWAISPLLASSGAQPAANIVGDDAP